MGYKIPLQFSKQPTTGPYLCEINPATSPQNVELPSSYDIILQVPATFQLATRENNSTYCVALHLPWRRSRESVLAVMFLRHLWCWEAWRILNVLFNGYITSVVEELESLDMYETIFKMPYKLLLEVKCYYSLAYCINPYSTCVTIFNVTYQNVFPH
jgi:hypothetical protein